MARHTSTPLAADDADEEEAPLWAALRRLPTLEQRARHAIVTLEDGSRKVADVGRVGSAERRALLARLLRSGVQEDNERFLLKLKDRIDRVVPSAFSVPLPCSKNHQTQILETLDCWTWGVIRAAAPQRATHPPIPGCGGAYIVAARLAEARAGALVDPVRRNPNPVSVSSIFNQCRSNQLDAAPARCNGAICLVSAFGIPVLGPGWLRARENADSGKRAVHEIS
ncbi:hypothetical protein ACQ4PT_055202 [Festuca glaucescens]